MNKTLTSMIAVLLVVLQQPVWAEADGAKSAAQPTAPAGAEPTTASTEDTGAKAEAEEKHEPITGAFGIKLGEPFKPSMVARVLKQKEQTYRGADGAEFKGSLFTVEPRDPDERFQRYAIKTTSDGMIYAIQAEYQFETDKSMSEQGKPKRSRKLRKTCKNAVKSQAKEFQVRYGEPRGKGWDGEWYAFRQLGEGTDKSLRLYANRCRTGLYSVVYTDQALLGIQAKQAKRQQKPAKEEQQEQKQEMEEQQEKKQTSEQES